MRNTNDCKYIFSTVILVLLSLDVWSQTTYYRVIGGIPHLPVFSSTSSVSSPASGMVIYSTGDACPMLYTGSAWVDMCTSSSFTANAGYFKIVGGIPVFPVKSSVSGSQVIGSVYLSSSASGVLQVYNGSSWADVDAISGLSASSGSRMNAELKLPVLASAPTVSGLSAGAIYLSSADNTLYWYDGSAWQELACALLAPDGTAVVELTSPGTGRIWMDRNLGASRAATSSTDYLAYGSLFQWCRAADGHQLITWTGSSAGTAVNSTTSTKSSSTTPGHSLFIINTSSPYDWLSTQQTDGSLWWNGTTAGANNPCPDGYHVPTSTEWSAEIDAGITTYTTAYSLLKLPVAGCRSYSNGSLSDPGSRGYYWYSSVNGPYAYHLRFTSSFASVDSYVRASGFSVRCLKD